MTNQTINKTNIELLKTQKMEPMNDYSIDLVQELPSGNIDDSIWKFADANTSIYYNEQREFYFNNTDICEEALDEFGYNGERLGDLLRECGDLDGLICKAGAIGEFLQIEREIWEDNEKIRELYALNEIIRKGLDDIDADALDDLLESCHDCEDWEEIDDLINDAFGGGDNE